MTKTAGKKETIKRATDLATKVINGRHLPKQASREQLAEAFGAALASTQPRSGHGQVLTGALRAQHAADRNPAQQAAWWLAVRGQTPTEQAVARKLEEIEARRAKRTERAREAAELAERDGPRAALWVADVVARTGTGPTWLELAKAMDWPRVQTSAVIGRIQRAGWLATGTEPRSLRPGGGRS